MSSTSFLSAFLSLASVLSPLGLAWGADWPQWRGPHRDGISPDTGLLAEWPAGGPTLAWKANGLGHGYSSVSVSGSRIYSMGDAADTSFIYAFGLDGKPVWSAK